MFTNHREAYRQAFFEAWEKHLKKQTLELEPVEAQLIEIMLYHPEYHALLEKPAAFQQQEFTLEENPFFHMSLHLAVREQIRTNRPTGIAQIHQELMAAYQDIHQVEHLMMTCLAQMLWKAQQTGEMPNDENYLEKLREIK
ncbi:DUF1841 family protein [Aquicella lusitana]|uniref:Uncharacterized protein DUF1841 n=1 Tax=Aquicella lusitana TaxID=254246 RepID=A0A370GKC2_9COXI|nr:DUF1841 family protein [Aquicella lusitana]RDI42834.1 uncharacterized protein DUF1841 [Aquicella lusitana]VVC73077.1 hypothetical protein AQULUS_08080 [Aquicella lusitana]